MNAYILLIKSPDQKGIVAKTTTFVFERGFNILDCQQHADPISGDFFMRLKLEVEDKSLGLDDLKQAFAPIADVLGLEVSFYDCSFVERVAILVSRTSHCLYDLLVRVKEGELDCDVPLVIGNHDSLSDVAQRFDIPFHHLPVTADTRADQEGAIRRLLQEHRIGLVVLARYMQILSPQFVADHEGRIINIHHAFLPAFQGAGAYQRAYERGVKMIGATAHYVTAELDQGPIIEQDTERVTHEYAPRDLRRIGRDIERVVLAKAVKAHLEHRIIIAGQRTIVFSDGV